MLPPRWRFVRPAGREVRAARGIIAIAAALAGLAGLLAIEMQHWTAVRLTQLDYHGLVLLPARTDADKLAILAKQIGSAPNVNAEPLDSVRRAQLLAFWLGAEIDPAALPVPQAIEIEFTGPVNADAVAALEVEIRKHAPQAMLKMHAVWAARLRQLLRGGQMVMGLAAAVLLTALVAAIALACRARLAAHQRVLNLLPLLGATPAFLARRFAWYFFRAGFFASLAGVVLATGFFLAGRRAVFFFLETAPARLWPEPVLESVLLLAAIPLFCAIAARIAARRQVFAWLAEQERE